MYSWFLNFHLPHLLQEIAWTREFAIKLEALDDQRWLDYQDELNKLSIDPDR